MVPSLIAFKWILGRFKFSASASSSSKDLPRSFILALEVALDLRPFRFSQRECMITMAEATTAAVFSYAEDIIDEDELLSVVQRETERTNPLFPYLT